MKFTSRTFWQKAVALAVLLLLVIAVVTIFIFRFGSGEWVDGVRVDKVEAYFACNVREYRKGCVRFSSDLIDEEGHYRYLQVGSPIDPYEGLFPIWVRLPCGLEVDLSVTSTSTLKEKATSIRNVSNERVSGFQSCKRLGFWPNGTEELQMGSWFFYIQHDEIISFKTSYFEDHWLWPDLHFPALGFANGGDADSICFHEFPLSYGQVCKVFGKADNLCDYICVSNGGQPKQRQICDYFEDIYQTQGDLSIKVEPSILRLPDPYTPFNIQVIFSNSTEEVVVLAEDDIDLWQNITVGTMDYLLSGGSPFINRLGFGKKFSPDIVKLKPGEYHVHTCELKNAVQHGVAYTDSCAELHVAFNGWNNECACLVYMLEEFPKELHPYVWTKPVTSMPIRVEFEETGRENQLRRHLNKSGPTNYVAGQVHCDSSNAVRILEGN